MKNKYSFGICRICKKFAVLKNGYCKKCWNTLVEGYKKETSVVYEDPDEYFSTFELTCSWKGCKNKSDFTVGSFRLCKKHAMELEGSLKEYVKEVEEDKDGKNI